MIPVDYRERIVQTLNSDFSLSGTLHFQDMKIETEMQKSGGTLVLHCLEPEPFSGLMISLDAVSAVIEYYGIAYTLAADTLPGQAVPEILRLLLTGQLPDGFTVTEQEDTVTASGTAVIAAYEMTFEKETMQLARLSVPSLEAELIIKEFAVVPPEEG